MIRKALYVAMAVVMVCAAFSGVSVAQEAPAVNDVATLDGPEHIVVSPLEADYCSIGTLDGGDYDDGGGGGGTGGGGGC